LGVATVLFPLTASRPLMKLVTHRLRFPYAALFAIYAAGGAGK